MIRRKRADTFIYRLYCDVCGAEMRARGPQPLRLEGRPVEHIHRCDNEKCDYTETITNKAYPAIDYVEINEEVAATVTPPGTEPTEPEGAA